jgi:hypothetical protein
MKRRLIGPSIRPVEIRDGLGTIISSIQEIIDRCRGCLTGCAEVDFVCNGCLAAGRTAAAASYRGNGFCDLQFSKELNETSQSRTQATKAGSGS